MPLIEKQTGEGFRLTNYEAYENINGRLKNSGIDNSEFESLCIFEDIMGIDRLSLAMNGRKTADENNYARALDLAGRRINGEPLQYLLGEWEFYGLRFRVGRGVLIPRPDTEILVDAVLSFFKERSKTDPEIIDLCSGSGCIAVALAKNMPQAKVSAVEISSEAFPYLVENIRRNNVSVKLYKGDVTDGRLLDNFLDEEDFGEYRKLDCVVSNPPYLTAKEMSELQTEVGFEPKIALDGGADGLEFYRIISCLWKEIIAPGGLIAFETGYEQGEAVSDILKNSGFENITVIKDFGGRNRVVTGIKIGNTE